MYDWNSVGELTPCECDECEGTLELTAIDGDPGWTWPKAFEEAELGDLELEMTLSCISCGAENEGWLYGDQLQLEDVRHQSLTVSSSASLDQCA